MIAMPGTTGSGSALGTTRTASGEAGADRDPSADNAKIDILIVDDLPEKLLALESILTPLNQNLVQAKSGREALRLILQRDFSVIILDINMPGMDGFETATLIRQRDSSAHTPIIFVTSFSTADTEVYRGYSLGAVDYLFTPIVPEVLRSKVNVFIELQKKSRQVQRQAVALRKAEEDRLQRQLDEASARLEWETRRNHFFRLSIELLAITNYEGVFTQTNPTWAKTLGYDEGELHGHSLHEFIHPEDAAATRAWVSGVLQADAPQYLENRFRSKSGEFRWLGWTIAPFAAQGLLYVFARDMTERRQREEEVRQLNENLRQQARILQALNQELEAFSYSISHDLRAPLRAISSYSGMLLAGEAGALPPEASQIVGAVNRNSLQMAQLIEDFLNFFRVGQLEVKVTAIDMAAAAKDAIASLRDEQGKRSIEFTVGALPAARGDRVMVGQVLINLISNAIKFTAGKKKAKIEIGAQNGSGPVVYYVKDNGVGFSMEHYSKLFGVFQRLHNRSDFAGTGIGLAIVQKIVQRHGGKVWAEAVVDKGATFFFTLSGE